MFLILGGFSSSWSSEGPTNMTTTRSPYRRGNNSSSSSNNSRRNNSSKMERERIRQRVTFVLLTGVFSALFVIKEQLVILGPSSFYSTILAGNDGSSSLSSSSSVSLSSVKNLTYEEENDDSSSTSSSPTNASSNEIPTSSSASSSASLPLTLSPPPPPLLEQQQSNSNNATRQLLPLCTRQQIKRGRWVPVTLDKPPYVVSTKHLKCYPDEMYHTKSWNTYDWKPFDAVMTSRSNNEKIRDDDQRQEEEEERSLALNSSTTEDGDSFPSSSPSPTSCVMSRWDRDEFCTLMHRSTIMIIGDSLSWEQFRSLNHLLGQRHVSQHSMWESKSSQDNIKSLVCKNQVRLVFRRDDLLTNVSDAIFYSQTFPQVVVLNRGSHYKNDTTLLSGMNNEVIPAITDWQGKCRDLGLKCHLFWRTSVPGHPGCNATTNTFTQPVNDITEMERLIADMSMYNNRTIEYHWYDYKHQNSLVVDLLQNKLQDYDPPVVVEDSNGGGNFERMDDHHDKSILHNNTFDIIDAYDLNVLRPDEHRAHQGDCLHNCYPGKMDVYNQLLLHFLKMRRTVHDVHELIAFQDAISAQMNANSTDAYQSK